MKKINLSFLAVLICGVIVHAQNYTWMKGSSQNAQNGIYGTKGTPSTNNTPGSRSGAFEWTDNNGNLWLYGGYGHDAASFAGHLNDLWMFDITTNMWTWVNGSNVALQPAVYGTKGVSSPSNQPGSRWGGSNWVDQAGNLWLLGGVGYTTTAASNLLNDLWKYTISTNEWTWVHGTKLWDQPGVYGAKLTPSSLNMPGGRLRSACFTDTGGNFWLYGGSGWDASTNNANVLGDLWTYNVSTNMWTWMHGSNFIFASPSYGSKGVSSGFNTPGSRYMTSGTTDPTNNLWLFGGNNYGELNDLWKFDISLNEWTWIRGSTSLNPNAVYGTQGTLSSLNDPGGRNGHNLTADKNGNLWLMGGQGLDGTASTSKNLNDLWRYSIAADAWVWLKGSAAQQSPGSFGTPGVTLPGNTPAAKFEMSAWLDQNDNYWLFGGADYMGTGSMNDLWKFSVCSAFTLAASSSQSIICSLSTVTLNAAGAITYTWTNLSGSNPAVTPATTTNYTVVGSNLEGCKKTVVFTQTVSNCTSVGLDSQSDEITFFPNPSQGEITVINNFRGKQNMLKVYNLIGQELVNKKLESGKTFLSLLLPSGIYVMGVYENSTLIYTKKLVVE